MIPHPPFDYVDRKRFDARVADVIGKAKKKRASLWARIKDDTAAFAHYAGEVIEVDVWLETLEQVKAVKPDTDVGMVQVYALEETLRIAESQRPNNNQLRAWAKIIDLTRPGSMLTSK